MTIKELAEFTGKTEKTVQNWVKKVNEKITLNNEKITLVKGQPTELTIDQVEIILNSSSMSKDAVRILMENARKSSESITNPINNTENILMNFMVKMQEHQQQFMTMVLEKLDNRQPDSKQLLLPDTPQEKPRALLRRLVNDYAYAVNITQQESWNELYKQFYYRCNENVKQKARNLKIIPLDYLEQSNKLLIACSIMKGLLNG